MPVFAAAVSFEMFEIKFMVFAYDDEESASAAGEREFVVVVVVVFVVDETVKFCICSVICFRVKVCEID